MTRTSGGTANGESAGPDSDTRENVGPEEGRFTDPKLPPFKAKILGKWFEVMGEASEPYVELDRKQVHLDVIDAAHVIALGTIEARPDQGGAVSIDLLRGAIEIFESAGADTIHLSWSGLRHKSDEDSPGPLNLADPRTQVCISISPRYTHSEGWDP